MQEPWEPLERTPTNTELHKILFKTHRNKI